jgi:hypothetical protein
MAAASWRLMYGEALCEGEPGGGDGDADGSGRKSGCCVGGGDDAGATFCDIEGGCSAVAAAGA